MNKVLAQNVIRLREERGWTQEELAENCQMCVQQISKIENMRTNTTVKTLEKLCKGFQIEMDELWRKNPPYLKI